MRKITPDAAKPIGTGKDEITGKLVSCSTKLSPNPSKNSGSGIVVQSTQQIKNKNFSMILNLFDIIFCDQCVSI